MCMYTKEPKNNISQPLDEKRFIPSHRKLNFARVTKIKFIYLYVRVLVCLVTKNSHNNGNIKNKKQS